MIVGQEVKERNNSPTFFSRSTNKYSFNTDLYVCIYHFFSVWHNFCNASSSETACEPPRTTVWKIMQQRKEVKWKRLPEFTLLNSGRTDNISELHSS